MTVLDENVRYDQGEQLRRWRIRVRFLVEDLAPSGVQDPDIIQLLHKRKGVSFFTHDVHFFEKSLIHPAYCLVWLDEFDGEGAEYIRRFLHHPDFNTKAKRMGKVVGIRSPGLRFWARGRGALCRASWI